MIVYCLKFIPLILISKVQYVFDDSGELRDQGYGKRVIRFIE